MSDAEHDLSPAGRDRRDAILQLAVGAARRKRRRRAAVRGAGAACALVLIAAIALQLIGPSTGTHEQIAAPSVPAQVPGPEPGFAHAKPQPQPVFAVAHIPTDRAITTRLAVAAEPPRWQSIDDDELLAALAQSGRPSGLIEMAGKTHLVSQASFP